MQRQISLVVATFLITPIPLVFVVLNDMLNAQLFGHFNGSIAAAIIHKDNVVNYIKGNLIVRFLQRFLSIIGRENNGYYFVIDHFAAVLRGVS